MEPDKNIWKEFFEKGKRPTYNNPNGLTEEELWKDWKKRNFNPMEFLAQKFSR